METTLASIGWGSGSRRCINMFAATTDKSSGARARSRVHHRIGTQLALLVIAGDSDRAGQFGNPSLAQKCGSRRSKPSTRNPGGGVVQAPCRLDLSSSSEEPLHGGEDHA